MLIEYEDFLLKSELIIKEEQIVRVPLLLLFGNDKKVTRYGRVFFPE